MFNRFEPKTKQDDQQGDEQTPHYRAMGPQNKNKINTTKLIVEAPWRNRRNRERRKPVDETIYDMQFDSNLHETNKSIFYIHRE